MENKLLVIDIKLDPTGAAQRVTDPPYFGIYRLCLILEYNTPLYVSKAITQQHTGKFPIPELPFADENELKNWILDYFCASYLGYKRVGNYIFTTNEQHIVKGDLIQLIQKEKWLRDCPVRIGMLSLFLF